MVFMVKFGSTTRALFFNNKIKQRWRCKQKRLFHGRPSPVEPPLSEQNPKNQTSTVIVYINNSTTY